TFVPGGEKDVAVSGTSADEGQFVRSRRTEARPGAYDRHTLERRQVLDSSLEHTAENVRVNTGVLLAELPRQFGEEHSGIDAHILSRMLQRAIEYLPALERMSVIRTWAGFRAATPDKLPLIGRCPGYRNIFLATGHE